MIYVTGMSRGRFARQVVKFNERIEEDKGRFCALCDNSHKVVIKVSVFSRRVEVIPLIGEMSQSDKRVWAQAVPPRPTRTAVKF